MTQSSLLFFSLYLLLLATFSCISLPFCFLMPLSHKKSAQNQPLFLSVFVGTSVFRAPTCKQLIPPTPIHKIIIFKQNWKETDHGIVSGCFLKCYHFQTQKHILLVKYSSYLSQTDLLDCCFCFSWGRLCWSFLVVLLPPISNTFLQLQNTPGFTTCKCLRFLISFKCLLHWRKGNSNSRTEGKRNLTMLSASCCLFYW